MKKMIPLLLILSLLAGILSGCGSSGVSGSLRQEIQDAYRSTFLSPAEAREYEFANEDADTVAGMQYYGTYNGYAVLMNAGMLAIVSSAQIGPYIFQWGSGDLKLYAYKDGEFHDLKDVYEAGYLTDEEIGTVAAAHKDYFAQNHGWDYDIEATTPTAPQSTTTQATSQSPRQIQITNAHTTVTKSNTHDGTTYSFDLRYEITFSESDPSTVCVTLYATNLGEAIHYQGNESHLFSLPEFTLDSAEIEYAFPEDLGISDDDATPCVFESGATVSFSYCISIPDDAPAGSYGMNFLIRTVRGEFEDVIAITDK